MKAIQDLHRYVRQHPGTSSSATLTRISKRLRKEEPLLLSELYSLDWDGFQLAIGLLRDWRIDRHYADRIDLPEGR